FEGEDDRLNINISGTHFEVNVDVLLAFPNTVLGNPGKRARYLAPGSNEYFIPRHATSFESILYYYITDGVLTKSETIPAIVFYEEIRFFELEDKLTQAFYGDYLSMAEEIELEPDKWWKRSMWRALRYPPTGKLGAILSLFSATFNALSLYSLCLETMNSYRSTNDTMWLVTHPLKPENNTLECNQLSLRPYQFIPDFDSTNTILEVCCTIWFWFELIFRTISAPSFSFLINDVYFALDILSILPTVLALLFYRLHTSQLNDEQSFVFEKTRLFDVLSVFKLLRLLRFTKHAQCLKIFIRTLYVSLKDIIMLFTLMIFGALYFGLGEFVLEHYSVENELTTIGEALWHGFTIIITIGYSDITEYRPISYVLALIGVCYGSIVMAITLPSVTAAFQIFQNMKYRKYTIKYAMHE
ncbi:unnamed protein product, partial [Didymodactylos carnosus]